MPSVSEPASAEEAAAVFAEAARAGSRVSIGREGGDVVLSTAGLARVVEHAHGDLTVTVEAGVRLSALQAELAKAGQRLSLDPPGDPTLGALVATNAAGPLRHRYGSPRDLLLGVTVVLADGTVASSGGVVVKNVAGYDLGKLLCGSRGRLGLLARLSLRLHPAPVASRTVVVDVGGPEEAARLWQALQRSTLVPSAVDLLWPERLAVLFEGGEQAVAAQVEAAVGLLGGVEVDGEVWAESRERQAVLPGLRSFAPGELAGVLGEVGEGVVRPGPGVAHIAEKAGPGDDPVLAALRERIRTALDPEAVLV